MPKFGDVRIVGRVRCVYSQKGGGTWCFPAERDRDAFAFVFRVLGNREENLRPAMYAALEKGLRASAGERKPCEVCGQEGCSPTWGGCGAHGFFWACSPICRLRRLVSMSDAQADAINAKICAWILAGRPKVWGKVAAKMLVIR